MLGGKNDPGFLKLQALRLESAYCLLMALALGLLAAAGYLQQASLEAVSMAGLAALLASYGAYLRWCNSPARSKWTEWVIVAALVLWTLTGANDHVLGVHAAYWLPFYLVLAVRWSHAAMVILVFAVLFSGLVLLGDLEARAQVLTTFLVSVATALCFGWLNASGEAHMLEQLGDDPQTGAYTENQLVADLSKEIPRADRQASRLLLAVIIIPADWKRAGSRALVSQLKQIAAVLKQYSLPFHKVYRLDSDDFVVVMPHGKSADMMVLETHLAPLLGDPDELPVVALHYQPDDDQQTLLQRVEEAIDDFSR